MGAGTGWEEGLTLAGGGWPAWGHMMGSLWLLLGNYLKGPGSSWKGLDSGCELWEQGRGCTWGGEQVVDAPHPLGSLV